MPVGAFNQKKALIGAFSVIVKTGCGTDGALHSTSCDVRWRGGREEASASSNQKIILRVKCWLADMLIIAFIPILSKEEEKRRNTIYEKYVGAKKSVDYFISPN